MKNQMVIL